MDWEQKFAAINALSRCTLSMRKPGDWYVSSGRLEIAGDGCLTSPTQSATTPDGAVEEYWRQIVSELPANHYLMGGDPGHTKCVRWNGYMWEDASHMRKPPIHKAS